RFEYNGWASPMLLPQIIFGALITKLFGFSYLALDMGDILLGGVSAGLMFYLSRLCGLSRIISAIATGTVFLNPITIAIMPSFMTEIPSLVLLLMTFVLMVKAVRSDSSGRFFLDNRLLLLSLVVGVIAGSNRQNLWGAYLGLLIVAFV